MNVHDNLFLKGPVADRKPWGETNMVQKNTRALAALTAVSILAVAASAQAGGLERGGYNIDLLFDPSDYAIEGAVTYVNPKRKIENAVDVNTGINAVGGGNLNGRSSTADETESYLIPRAGVKAGFGPVDCIADYSQPWGVHSNPGVNWAGANDNIETKVNSHNYGATCSYGFDAGQGTFKVIGGAFYQEIDGFKERLVLAPPFALGGAGTGVGRLDLETDGWGWRAGVAYEITEYALRASLVYNSEVKLDDITGTLNLSQVNGLVIPVFGKSAMPESVELKVQSGIAPGWLAFGSVKWTDWSQLQTIPFCSTALKGVAACTTANQATSLDLFYKDGWTVTGGVGHKFNDQWSGAVSLTWDRGTATTQGTQSDTWTLGTGVSYTPTENVEFRLAGAVGILTSGQSANAAVTYDYGTDIVSAISTSLKVKF